MATRGTQKHNQDKMSCLTQDDLKRLRFDVQSLRDIAGEKVFDRGVAYHKEGAVDIIDLEENCVRARIVGSEIYEAELKLANGKISGQCSCPADRDFGFCKHLVATALTVNDIKPDAAQKTKSRIESVRDYLHDLPKESLVAMIKAAKVYRQSCRAAKFSPDVLAARLFRREMESSWGFFSGVSEEYRDILGEKGLEDYYRLAKDAWDGLPSVNPNRSVRDDYGLRRYTLKAILDSLAKNDHNLDARIALRTKDLSSPSHYLELADLCLENGREDEALKWAEEGLWQFKDDTWPDESLKQFTFDLYVKRGEKTKARNLIWNAFLQRPDLDKYAAMKDLSKDLAEQAIAFLQESVSKAEVKRDAKGIGAGTTPTYKKAVKLVNTLKTLQDAEAQAAYVTFLKEKYKAKRNFIKLM